MQDRDDQDSLPLDKVHQAIGPDNQLTQEPGQLRIGQAMTAVREPSKGLSRINGELGEALSIRVGVLRDERNGCFEIVDRGSDQIIGRATWRGASSPARGWSRGRRQQLDRAGAGNGLTATTTRARSWKRRTQPSQSRRSAAPVPDPTIPLLLNQSRYAAEGPG